MASKTAASKTIGILHSGRKGRHEANISAFINGMNAVAQGISVTIEGPLYAKGNPNTLAADAKTLIGQNLDVLVAAGGTASAVAAIQAATNAGNTTTAIVYTSVTNASGFNFAVPNATGICANTSEYDVPRLQNLMLLNPNFQTIGVLTNPSRQGFTNQWSKLQTAAGSVTLVQGPVNPTGLTPVKISNAINAAFATFQSNNVQAVLVTADSLFNDHYPIVLGYSLQYPTIYQWRSFVDAGGLMSYGPNIKLCYYWAGQYAGQILNGVSAATLLVKSPQPELIINLSTAVTLGFNPIPDALLKIANGIVVTE
jgi:putative tryptophan/tyrosine transport system substrate-binding protein